MAGLKRKVDDVDADEAAADAELARATKAAGAAPDSEVISGLGSGKAPLYFKVPGMSPAPWEYPLVVPKVDEKPLMFAYLAIRGLGEIPRLMLAEAGATYEHVACTMGEDQADALEWRSRSPTGLMPMLSGLGIPRATPLSQSGAIIRFIAKKYGMNGSDELEATQIDMLYETAKDFSGNQKLVTGGEKIDPDQAKMPAALAKRMEAMLDGMYPMDDDTKIMNYGQIALLHHLMMCDEVKPGCIATLSQRLDDWRKAGTARPRIAAYLASPMRFPMTCNEKGTEGGYNYIGTAPTRGSFHK